MKTDKNTFANGELVVTYEPKKCIHAAKCCHELNAVFRHSVIPWINLEGADSERIVNQIKKCPSGALSFERKPQLAEVRQF
ncbi:MAG: (4Fe-4S)-binding protein [Flavobacteriaceae bacterium]|nr:(4Fe-4S)-binding protein [Flavobacteriaceae bacterium]